MTAHFDRLAAAFGTDAVDRWQETPRVAPDSTAMASEVMRFAAREKLRVLPAGACEHLAPGWRAEFVLSTRRLTRVHEYEPEEMVIVAEAGLTLHALAALTAPHRQRLGPSPWPGQAATLGGAVAATRANLDRRGRGAMRDLILGARVLHADGRTSKTGGKVVKNVTGYDLAKLYTGSRGALAMLLELNVRLAPVPEAMCVMAAMVPATRAREHLLALHRAPLAPVALLLASGDVASWPTARDHVHVVARFEGSEAGVAWQRTEAARLVSGLAPVADPHAWESLQRVAEPQGDAILLQIASLPVDGPAVLAQLRARAASVPFVAQFGVGVAHVRLPVSTSITDLEAALASIGAHVRVLDAPATVAAGVGARVPDPCAQRLMQHIKAALDPEGRLPAIPDLEAKS